MVIAVVVGVKVKIARMKPQYQIGQKTGAQMIVQIGAHLVNAQTGVLAKNASKKANMKDGPITGALHLNVQTFAVHDYPLNKINH